MSDTRQLLTPWRVVELDDGYRVEDAEGVSIAHISMTRDLGQLLDTKQMVPEQAQLVAQAIAALPGIRGHLRRVEVQLEKITSSGSLSR